MKRITLLFTLFMVAASSITIKAQTPVEPTTPVTIPSSLAEGTDLSTLGTADRSAMLTRFYAMKNAGNSSYKWVEGDPITVEDPILHSFTYFPTLTTTFNGSHNVFYVNNNVTIVNLNNGKYMNDPDGKSACSLTEYTRFFLQKGCLDNSITMGDVQNNTDKRYQMAAVNGMNHLVYATAASSVWSNEETLQRQWYIYDVTDDLPVTIGTTGYITFSAPYAYKVPSDVTPYIITEDAGTTAKLVAMPQTDGVNIIPANAAVILNGQAGGTFNFTRITTDAPTGNFDGNLLKPSGTVPHTVGSVDGCDKSKCYILGNVGTSAAPRASFRKISQTEGENVMGAFKAYLDFTGTRVTATARQYISLDELADKSTAVDGLNSNAETTSKDGLFIENGTVKISKSGNKYGVSGVSIK